MKHTYFFMLILILSGCVARSQIMDSWVGKSESELVSAIGAPDNVFETNDGKKVLTWKTVSGDKNGVGTCIRSYTVDQGGIIERWSYQGCPNFYLDPGKLWIP